MSDNHQPNNRSAANRAFSESLEQLQNMLELSDKQPNSNRIKSDRHSQTWLDAQALEDAAADLDQYFGDA
ncbi:MAG: hypothetical protein KME06_02295 [Kastovskya adunca ATA6-11-RM4]|jgi:hypothetical protein|nr:hypothetical protein [Kastovskya adunca ATA6-11-RM4]